MSKISPAEEERFNYEFFYKYIDEFSFYRFISITRIKDSISFPEYIAKNFLFRCFSIHVSRKIVQYPFRIDLPHKDARFSLKEEKKNILPYI